VIYHRRQAPALARSERDGVRARLSAQAILGCLWRLRTRLELELRRGHLAQSQRVSGGSFSPNRTRADLVWRRFRNRMRPCRDLTAAAALSFFHIEYVVDF
jgi:hypothetical protein